MWRYQPTLTSCPVAGQGPATNLIGQLAKNCPGKSGLPGRKWSPPEGGENRSHFGAPLERYVGVKERPWGIALVKQVSGIVPGDPKVPGNVFIAPSIFSDHLQNR